LLKEYPGIVVKSEVFGGSLTQDTCSVDGGPGSGKSWTAENVILLVTLCSVNKVRNRYISQ